MKGKRCENSNIAELLANTLKASETIWRSNQIVTASSIKVCKYEISVIETLFKTGLFTTGLFKDMKHYIIPSLTKEMLGIAAIHTGENNINYKIIGMSRAATGGVL